MRFCDLKKGYCSVSSCLRGLCVYVPDMCVYISIHPHMFVQFMYVFYCFCECMHVSRLQHICVLCTIRVSLLPCVALCILHVGTYLYPYYCTLLCIITSGYCFQYP